MKSFDRRIERVGEFQLRCVLSNKGWAYENLQNRIRFYDRGSGNFVLLQIGISVKNVATLPAVRLRSNLGISNDAFGLYVSHSLKTYSVYRSAM